jgi:hypothetical protein
MKDERDRRNSSRLPRIYGSIPGGLVIAWGGQNRLCTSFSSVRRFFVDSIHPMRLQRHRVAPQWGWQQ